MEQTRASLWCPAGLQIRWIISYISLTYIHTQTLLTCRNGGEETPLRY